MDSSDFFAVPAWPIISIFPMSEIISARRSRTRADDEYSVLRSNASLPNVKPSMAWALHEDFLTQHVTISKATELDSINKISYFFFYRQEQMVTDVTGSEGLKLSFCHSWDRL
jgi:hypothetical protein